MSQFENVEKYEMEWKISSSWSEIINNLYNEKDEENKEDKEDNSSQKPQVKQNYDIKHINKRNFELISYSPLEKLLSLEPNISPNNEDIDYNSLKLIEFKKILINKLKEDIIYYCTSPQKLLNYKEIESTEKKVESYKDLDTENFLISQKERFDIILNKKDYSQQNLIKLDNVDVNIEISFPEKNWKNELSMQYINLLYKKLNIYNFNELKELDSDKILNYLNDIKFHLMIEPISPNLCGTILYSYIINNINLILEIILDKFKKEKNYNILEFIFILKDICIYISSIQLKFYLLKLIRDNLNILKEKNIDFNNYKIFMRNYINFNDIDYDNKYQLLCLDFKTFLNNENTEEENDNINELIINNHWTLNSGNCLYLFIQNPYKLKKNKDEQFLIFFQINLEINKILNFGKIELINKENNKLENIIDINISIRKEIIYIVYIIRSNINNIEKYYLKYQLYNTKMLCLNINKEKNIIEFSNFIPIRLINDSKYLYCFSESDKIFIIKRNFEFNMSKYANCKFKFNFQNFRMYNTFCINNYFILENIIENKKYSAIINNNTKGEYTLEIFELKDEMQVKNFKNKYLILNITFHDNIYILTALNYKEFELYFKIFKNDNNNNNYFLFPFNHYYLNYQIDNCYDQYLKEICFLLNMCCNNNSNNKITLMTSNIFCFRKSDLKFIIERIMERKEYDKIQLYYIIILRTIIKYQVQLNELKEESLINIFPILKQIVINGFLDKNKSIYNKIIKEIIIIYSYIKNITIIELNDIKFIFDEKDNIKTKLLLIELILEQEKTNNDINLYGLIIDIEYEFIKNILKCSENNQFMKLLKNYYLINETMKRAADTFYKICYDEKLFNYILIDIFLIISKKINDIIELYENQINKRHFFITYISILYNSFIFRSFYFIIQKITANNKINLKNNNIIILLYKTLLLIDKMNINDICNDFYDLDDIIEIKNSILLNTNENGYQREGDGKNYREIITLNKPKNIIIKTSLISYQNLRDFFVITLNDNYEVNLNFETEKIFRNISKINILMKNRDSIVLNDFVINIIPLKKDFNEEQYYIQRNINDNKILMLIEKSIIYYLLNINNDINNQIEEFDRDELIIQHSRIYEYDLFKFINIYYDNDLNLGDINSPLINKIIKFKKKIEESLGINLENFKILNQNLFDSIENINNVINYEKEMKIKDINKIEEINNNNKKYDNFEINKYDKLFNIFQKDLKKKNLIYLKSKKVQKIDELIKKLFFISIKYFDCFNKLDILMKNINKLNDNINDFESYNLFYSIYEESYKLKRLLYEKKSEINNNEKSDEIELKYEKVINFIYDNILSINDLNIKPDISIVASILNLIRKNNIQIEEIIYYSKIQNMKCEIKFFELSLINNLLNSLQKERNISFLLQLINEKIRKSNNNLFFHKIIGVGQLILEKLEKQLYLLMTFFTNNYLLKKNKLRIQILLLENFKFKIRKKYLPILNKILKIFEELKKYNQKEEEIFIFQHNHIYNFKYYNKNMKYNILFEKFKYFAKQILDKINLYAPNSDNKDLSLKRDISKISNDEYDKLFEIILSYFIDIKPDNIFYHDIILFFYKNFINSKNVLNYIKVKFIAQNIINKIINIALGNENIIEYNEEKYQLTQFIMTKLLFQIIENVDLDNLLVGKNKEENSYLYLSKIILNKLNSINENNILKKYFIKIILICFNKLIYLKECNKAKEFIKNNLKSLSNIILLLSDDVSWLSENEFIIQKEFDSNLSEVALFNSKGYKIEFHGEIICFLDSTSSELFLNYISNYREIFF